MSTENLYAGRCAVAFKGALVGVAAACPKLERKKPGSVAADFSDPAMPEWELASSEPASVTVEFAADRAVAGLFFGGGANLYSGAAEADLLETSGELALCFFEGAGKLVLTFPKAVLSQVVECGGFPLPTVRVAFTVFPTAGRLLATRSSTLPGWLPTNSEVTPRSALAAMCGFLNSEVPASDPLEAWRIADGVRRLGGELALTGEKPEKNIWRRTVKAEAALEYPTRARLEEVANRLAVLFPTAVGEEVEYAALDELVFGGAPARGGFAGLAKFSLLLSR